MQSSLKKNQVHIITRIHRENNFFLPSIARHSHRVCEKIVEQYDRRFCTSYSCIVPSNKSQSLIERISEHRIFSAVTSTPNNAMPQEFIQPRFFIPVKQMENPAYYLILYQQIFKFPTQDFAKAG